jgi:arylsulfatase A-like enzyme
MGAHRLFEKCVMFEEAVRVPYLVRMPNQRQPISISQPVSHIDLMPTILDLLGEKPHEQCVGKSRVPLMRGESMPPETVFMQWAPDFYGKNPKAKGLGKPEEIKRAANESTRAAITPDGWKICLRDADKNELYHLRSDPRELQNLYYRSDQKEAIARLTSEIHQWQERDGDTVKV